MNRSIETLTATVLRWEMTESAEEFTGNLEAIPEVHATWVDGEWVFVLLGDTTYNLYPEDEIVIVEGNAFVRNR